MRQLRTIPDPILFGICKGIHRFPAVPLSRLVSEMFEIMEAHDGIGLAAPQVGLKSELIIAQDRDMRYTLINPYPIDWDGATWMDEACLSIPGKIVRNVPRAEIVVVRYQDLSGQKMQIIANGLLARILQHEMDHLNGVLITEYGQATDASAR